MTVKRDSNAKIVSETKTLWPAIRYLISTKSIVVCGVNGPRAVFVVVVVVFVCFFFLLSRFFFRKMKKKKEKEKKGKET